MDKLDQKYKELLGHEAYDEKGIIDAVDKLLGGAKEDPHNFRKIQPSKQPHKLSINEVRNIYRSDDEAFKELEQKALRQRENEMEDELLQIKRER